MTDFANLGIRIDSSSVPPAVGNLDKLTAAGARAEAATIGLGRGTKTAAAAATAMAAEAQLSSRAAMGMAAGFTASTNAAKLNTIAMRETLVVARELSRGNFTRIPGSLSLLAQNVSGGFGAYASSLATTFGLIKKVQNAELAEQATNAAVAATAVQNAAERASANIVAADTELALAQASVRVAEGSTAETAAQARLAAAHEAVAAAAGEAAIAEDALAVAAGRANEAAAANAAATRTLIGGTGVGLIGLGIVAGVTYGAFKQLQDQIRDDGTLTDYRDSLGLTHRELLKLSDGVDDVGNHIKKLGDVTITFGDLMHGVWAELSREISNPSPWDGLSKNATSAFSHILSAWNVVSAGISTGLMTLGKMAGDALNPGRIKSFADLNYLAELKKNYGIALAQNKAAFGGITSGAIGSAEDRMRAQADALKEDRSPRHPRQRKPHESAIDTELQKLDAQIAGENALAAAYLQSDAAAIKAEADEKAMTLAVEKHANAAQTAALKQKELALAIASGMKDGAKLTNNLRFEADTREAVNNMVKAGIIPASQANAELELETQLRPLAALAANAHGEALAKLVEVMSRLTRAHDDLNKQIAREKALQDIASNDNEIAKIQLETSMIGASNKERAVAIAQLEAMQKLKDMPGLSPGEQQNFIQSYINKANAAVQTPFQQWAATVPQTADRIKQDLQSIEFKGFDTLASGITDVIMGTKSLGAAFKDIARSIIADIIQMTIKMLIFRAISAAFGGGGGSIIPLSGGVMSITPSANGNVFSGGNIIPFATGGVVSSPTLFPMSGGRTGLMGEAGDEAVIPLARDSHGRLGVRANDNVSGPIEITIGFGDAPDFAPYVQAVSAQAAGEAVKISVGHTNRTLRSIARPKLMGR